MKTTILTLLKGYAYPILKYILGEARTENFNVKRIATKAIEKREYLAKKLLDHTLEKGKLALENFADLQEEMELVEGYAGTIEDEELMGGVGSPTAYNGEPLPLIPYTEEAYDQLENKDRFGYTQCFQYAPLTNATLNGVAKFTPEQRYQASVKTVSSDGYDIRYGGKFSEGNRITREVMDERGIEYDAKMISSQSRYLRTVLDAGYAVCIGIRISSDLYSKMRADGVLDNTDISGEHKYNHLVNFKKNKEGTFDIWIDNYSETRLQNVFDIEDIEFLAKSGKFMNTCTFFVPKISTLKASIKGYEYINEIDETKYDMKLLLLWFIAYVNKDPITQLEHTELSDKDNLHAQLASRLRMDRSEKLGGQALYSESEKDIVMGLLGNLGKGKTLKK